MELKQNAIDSTIQIIRDLEDKHSSILEKMFKYKSDEKDELLIEAKKSLREYRLSDVKKIKLKKKLIPH